MKAKQFFDLEIMMVEGKDQRRMPSNFSILKLMGGKGEKTIVYRSRSVSDENYYTQKLRTSRFTRRITL